MNRNAETIIILCSHLCITDDIKPLEANEWATLAEQLRSLKLQPEVLLDFEKQDFINQLNVSENTANRFKRLLERSGSLRFEISKYEDMGIQIITRADSQYPKQLKKKLGNSCPPLFYSAGDLNLLKKEAIGYVGSRSFDSTDIEFTKHTVAKTAAHGYAVVSGGARGIDSISASAAISEGVFVIEYISDSMLRKMRDSELVREIRNGRVLLMSVVIPTAGFNVEVAMMRNRYIYAQSSGTVVIRSDKGKGGTWAGATENLKHKWCQVYCRDYDYPGNKELIRLGAIPVTETWSGRIDPAITKTVDPSIRDPVYPQGEQLSMFAV